LQEAVHSFAAAGVHSEVWQRHATSIAEDLDLPAPAR